jgi:plasminogen activator inhibitor 1 RNA-binding protein
VEEEATGDAAADVTADWGVSDAAPAANDWGGDAAPPADDPWAAPPATTDNVPPTQEGDKPADREQRKPRDRDQEEEDNTLTLEQYLAQKKENELIPKLEATRKANEGADDTIWKDTVPLKKTAEEDAYFVGKSKSTPKARAKKDEKVFLEIDARFERPSRGGRGGRGGDRGGGDRGSDRAPRGGRGRGGPSRGRPNGSTPVNVDDEKAFPSLS